MVQERHLARPGPPRLVDDRPIPQSGMVRADVSDKVDRSNPTCQDIAPGEAVPAGHGGLIIVFQAADKVGEHPEIPQFDGDPDRQIGAVRRMEVFDEILGRTTARIIKAGHPFQVRDLTPLVRPDSEIRMQFTRVAMRCRAAQTQSQSHVDAERDLNPFYRIQHQHSELFVEDVQVNYVAEARAFLECVLDLIHWRRGRSVGYGHLAHRIPVAAEPVISDPAKTLFGLRLVRYFHASGAKQRHLIDDRDIGFGVRNLRHGALLDGTNENRPVRPLGAQRDRPC